jgi:Tfp pilus assembly protein PilN
MATSKVINAQKPLRQEVNLYLPELRKAFDPLSLNMAAVACAVVAGFVLLLALIGFGSNMSLENDIAALEQQKQQLETTVIQLRQSAPKSRAGIIQKEVDALEAKVAARGVIRQIITGQNLGNSRGFSGHFHGFSRQIGREVALNSFQLSRGGAHVELQGVTRKASAVPRFLELLQEEENFRGTTFGQLQMARQVDGRSPQELQFSLGRELAAVSEGGR